MTNREEIEILWSDQANWTWGVIYRCAKDPRVIVPRRWRWGGWTLNFGHPNAAKAGLAAFSLAVGPGLLTLFVLHDHVTAFIIMLLSVATLIAWAHHESSRTK